jgi:hypothetical protein
MRPQGCLVEFDTSRQHYAPVLEWANVMCVTGDHDNDERERCADDHSINQGLVSIRLKTNCRNTSFPPNGWQPR